MPSLELADSQAEGDDRPAHREAEAPSAAEEHAAAHRRSKVDDPRAVAQTLPSLPCAKRSAIEGRRVPDLSFSISRSRLKSASLHFSRRPAWE